MDIRFIAAAMSEALGAPNIVTVDDDSSTGLDGNTGGFVFKSNGTIAKYVEGVPIVVGNWITPQTNISQYEIRFTKNSGSDPTSGTLNTWMALSTDRRVEVQTSTPLDVITSEILAEIRWTTNNEVQDSGTLSLGAAGPSS